MVGLLVAALWAGSASANVVMRASHAPVRARGLSSAERQAITISAISLAGDDSVGTFVRVTFKGDVERYLGQGHLRSGRLALVLIPTHGSQLSGLVDQGQGAAERVLPFTAARTAGAVRHEDHVTFYLADARLSRFAKIELKVFATSATHVSWRQLAAAKPTSQISVPVNATRLSCSQLSTLAAQLGSLGGGLEVRRQRLALRTVRHQVAASRSAACMVPVSAPPSTTPTATAAGTTPTALPPAPPVSVVQTDAGLSQQLAPQPGLSFSTAPPAGEPVIGVNDQLAYQRFGGVGAAITDSAASLIHDQLSATDQATLMQELFGASGGIHLNFLRIAIGASGAMTVGPAYSYDDQPSGQTDPTLAGFSISHDESYIIPTLRQALSINPGLEILANPWSPPGWMKSNDSLGNQNDSGTLISSDYQVLADYFVKTIQAYAADGVPIAAITPQNEPRTTGSGTQYPGLTFPEPDEATFIADDLAPALKNAGLQTKIYGNDLSWDSTAYADGLAADTAAAPDLAGIAWHCYFGNPDVMTQLEQSSSLDQIVDECSPEIRGFGTPEFLISSLRNWASVVSVWTAATDPSGGPIQPGNNCGGCRGLVTIDENAHTATLRTEYYQLGQVSSFVQPGARRIDSPSLVTYGVNGSNIETVSSGLDDVAFLNPDGSKVLVAYDNSAAPISFAVESDGRYFTYTIPAQAMTTFVWR